MAGIYTKGNVRELYKIISRSGVIKDNVNDVIKSEKRLLVEISKDFKSVNNLNDIIEELASKFKELAETERLIKGIYARLKEVTHKDNLDISVIEKANEAIKIIDGSKEELAIEMKKCENMLRICEKIEEIIKRHSKSKKSSEDAIDHLKDLKTMVEDIRDRLGAYYKIKTKGQA
jgi:predicted nuclease with TOPRIM domain